MSIFTNIKIGCVAATFFLMKGTWAQAQNDPIYIDGPTYISAAENLQWYGPVILGPNTDAYIEDAAHIYFYGSSFTVAPGAKISGANSLWTVLQNGLGTGNIAFQQPNPMDGSTVQQMLGGGFGGNITSNTFTSVEINNPMGVKLTGSNTRVGSNIKFTNGHLFLDTFDANLSSGGTLTGYDENKYVVTEASGHLVKENYAGPFEFPVGMAVADFTPAAVSPASANTIHVNVTSYTSSSPTESTTVGMERSWNIFGNNIGPAQVALQHNEVTNQPGFVNTGHFVTRYGATPNNTGDATSSSGWQSNTLGGGNMGSVVGSTVRDRQFNDLASSASADEAWYTKVSSSSLPVVLVRFKASQQGGNAVLSWRTTAEINSFSFEIESSTNGYQFNKIGEVFTGDDSHSEKNYNYIDQDLARYGANKIYYRLKQIDNDGSIDYSFILVVIADQQAVAKLNVYPVPFKSILTVNLPVEWKSPTKIVVTDMSGRTLYQETVEGKTGSQISLTRISDLPKGLYFLTATNQQGIKTIKLIKE